MEYQNGVEFCLKYLKHFLLLYCYSITVVCIFSTPTPAKPSSRPCFHPFKFFSVVQMQLSPFSHHQFPPLYPPSPPTLNGFPPLALSMDLLTCSLTTLPFLSPVNPLLPPHWLLPVCSLFQCLWLYFACLFVLLIRFHL